MAGQDQRDEVFLRGLFDAAIERARRLSEYMSPGAGGKRMTDDEIEQAWNERAMPVEQEWELWKIGKTPETAGMRPLTPEEIGLRVFPRREKLAKSGGRVRPSEFIGWTNNYAERRRKAKEQQQAPMMGAEGMMTDG